MILEAAYNNNTKPDKQARLAIVERVSLSEKEVQVRTYAMTHDASIPSSRRVRTVGKIKTANGQP